MSAKKRVPTRSYLRRSPHMTLVCRMSCMSSPARPPPQVDAVPCDCYSTLTGRGSIASHPSLSTLLH